jgi:RNA polymerase sigma factor (sigma-70 family)
MNDVIRHLRQAALLQEATGLTDRQLLEGFLAQRDEAAFAALVRRHGPMVLGVCRRVLGNHHDAEDAFQATFLVLARKAGSVRAREVVGHWLYGVAYRTALKARSMTARRRAKEQQVKDMPQPEVPADDGREDLLPLLDRELNGLPERYRVAVVLCDLQGLTRREAARRLNLPEGTLSGRLTRARRLLARRLARYGLAVSGAALAAVLSDRTASAAVTGGLTLSTAKAAVLVAAGQGLTAGAVPARVLALTEGVIKAMLLTKLRVFVAVVVVAFIGAGVVGLAYRTTAAEPARAGTAPAAAGADRPAADDLEALRLEVEALRKSLQGMRARLDALEAEVHAPKPATQAAPQAQGGFAGGFGFSGGLGGGMGGRGGGFGSARQFQTGSAPADDPLMEAEAALMKLRQDPSDKQATEALERALQRLKERTKSQGAPKNPQRE